MSPIAPEAVQHQVKHRLAALRLLPYADLTALPAVCTEDVPFGERVARVITYREVGPNDALEIVVQRHPDERRSGPVWTGVFADGFWMWPDGRIEPLPDPIRFYYM